MAYRALIKHKAFTVINVTGLAVGLAATILILLWVQYETSYDGFHENTEDIYHMGIEWPVGDETHKALSTPPPLAAALKQDFPELKNTARFNSRYKAQVKVNSGSYKEELVFADPAMFEIFDFPLKSGNLTTFEESVDNIFITEEFAEKLFGNEDALGKTLSINNNHILTVSGILQNIPANSFANYGIFIPFPKIKDIANREDLENWGSFRHRTYIQFHKNADIEKFSTDVYNYISKYTENNEDRFFIWPLHKLHLYDVNGGGSYIYIYMFSAVAFLILLLAGINFMNLSTARSSLRSREIGLRKLTGAKRGHIITQFFIESLFLALLALGLSIMLVELLLPAFITFTGAQVAFNLASSGIMLLLLGITFSIGIIAGSYPALFLSSFQPVDALKGSVKSGSSLFRKILVVMQFTISIALIICLLIISSQISFMSKKELGYEDKNVLLFSLNSQLKEQKNVFFTELISHSGINAVCTSSNSLGMQGASSTLDLDWEGNDSERSIEIKLLATDSGFLNTFQIKLDAGEFINADSNQDIAQVVLNETAVKHMMLEDPVGKRVELFGEETIVVGVIKDYHFESLYDDIEPLILFEAKEWQEYFAVSINPVDKEGAIEHLEKVYQKFSPDFPFEVRYLSDMLLKLYKTEKQAKTLFQFFVLLALFISSLGLFGLASFIAERRTKEVGIRKVLGSTVKEIVWLLASDFSKWVLIANLIAWPLAWFSMHRWLQNFAYQTTINLWFFLFAGLLTLFVALITISFQTIKTAMSNPVDILKCE